MISINHTMATLGEARGFMRLATPGAGAMQIEDIIRQDRGNAALWLEAALLQGHFDVGQVSLDIEWAHQLSDLTLDYSSAAAQSLAVMLSIAGEALGNDPSAARDDAGYVVVEPNAIELGKLGSWRACTSPQMPAILDRIAHRIWESAQEAMKTTPSMTAAFGRERDDGLRWVIACAASIDHVPLIARWLDVPEFRDAFKSMPFVVRHALGPSTSGAFINKDSRLHMGALAANFGANKVLQYFIDSGWQLSAHAGWTPGRFSDAAGNYVGMSDLFKCLTINLQVSTVKLILERMQVIGLTPIDRGNFGEFIENLGGIAMSHQAWADFMILTQLWRANPLVTAKKAAYFGCLDVLNVVQKEVAWSAPFDVAPHPVFDAIAHSGQVQSGDFQQVFDLIIDAVTCAGAQAVHSLLSAADKSGSGVASRLIQKGCHRELNTLLELGLDPFGRINNKPSAMEAAIDHGCEQSQFVIRAFLARQEALKALQDMQGPPAGKLHA